MYASYASASTMAALAWEWLRFSGVAYSYAYYAVAAYLFYVVISTVMRVCSVVSCTLRWIARMGSMGSNPTTHKLEPPQQQQQQTCSDEHLKAILHELRILNALLATRQPRQI